VERNEKRILIAAVTLLLVFFAGLGYAYRSYGVRIPGCVTDVRPFEKGAVIQRGENDFEVQMVAKMWEFEPAEVTLPPGSKVTLYLSTADVVHGMQVLGTNVNLMAVPGTVNLAEVTFDEEGEFPIVCHEYCGRNHQNMAGKFIIREGATLEPPVSVESLLVDMEALFDEYDCLACHTLDGTGEDMAPSFKNLLGRSRKLTDGRTLIADEAYLLESIVDPEKHVVEGYDPMPELDEIPEDDLQAMMEALRRLADEQGGS
jgi:cytochrome c oxidase subunit 2